MSGMTWSAQTIGAKVVTVTELSLIERLAIEICDLVTNLNGVLRVPSFSVNCSMKAPEGATTGDGI